MVNNCLLCKKISDPLLNRSLHPFPKDDQLLEKWLSNMGLKKVSVWSRLCSDHFNKNDFIDASITKRKLLKPTAIPSIVVADPETRTEIIDKVESIDDQPNLICNQESVNTVNNGNQLLNVIQLPQNIASDKTADIESTTTQSTSNTCQFSSTSNNKEQNNYPLIFFIQNYDYYNPPSGNTTTTSFGLITSNVVESSKTLEPIVEKTSKLLKNVGGLSEENFRSGRDWNAYIQVYFKLERQLKLAKKLALRRRQSIKKLKILIQKLKNSQLKKGHAS